MSTESEIDALKAQVADSSHVLDHQGRTTTPII